MSELTQPITDQKISTLLGKLKQVWRVNRITPLGQILDEIKSLCDNPYTEISDLGNDMLEQGADRFLVQEHRDHPERFVKADEETKAEEQKQLEVKKEKEKEKPFKSMTKEEQKAWRVENLRKAREKKKLLGVATKG